MTVKNTDWENSLQQEDNFEFNPHHLHYFGGGGNRDGPDNIVLLQCIFPGDFEQNTEGPTLQGISEAHWIQSKR